MATITKREGKKGFSFQIKVMVGLDAFNKQVQKTATWKNKDNLPEDEALAAASKFAAEFEEQAKKDFANEQNEQGEKQKGKIKFSEFITSYWVPYYVEDGSKKPSTVANYKQHIKPALEYFNNMYLTTISPEWVDKFLKWVRTEYVTQYGAGATEKSTKHYYVAFNNALKYAKKLKFISELPTAETKTPEVHRKPVEYLNQEQAKQFLEALNQADFEFRVQMYILLTTGLRRGELLGLQWQDINYMRGTARISRAIVPLTGSPLAVSTPKTDKSNREVPLTTISLGMLASLRTKSKSEWVFERRNPNSLTRKLKRFMKRNGLPDCSPHDLRHTCASLLNANSVDLKTIQQLLGHTDAKTTLNYYIGVDISQVKGAVNELEKALA